MINLEEFNCDETVKDFDFKIEAGFGGFLEEGFVVKCCVDVDYKLDAEDREKTETNEFNGMDIWLFEIFDAAGDEVTFTAAMIREIKNDIENELTKKIEQ